MTDHTKQYYLNHHLVNKVRGPAKSHACEHCGRPAQDWATITGLDSAADAIDPWTGFIALCRKCHRAYDQSMPDWTGKHHAPETIEKIRRIKLGHQNHTPESREKISRALRGKPRPRKHPVEIRHGTATGYRRGCRCDSCRAAQAAYKRAARAGRS